jgi:large subunit ribosomal protein L23
MTLHDIIRRPLVTEKGVMKKETELTLCFEVAPHANKVQVKAAVEKLFKVKVDHVRTCNFEGKERRRGRFSGFRPDWKKAYVRLKAGEKAPDWADI